MKSVTSLAPPRIDLNGIQFSILNVLETLIPKDQKKYNNYNKYKYVGATFYGRHTALDTHCCEYKKSGKKSHFKMIIYIFLFRIDNEFRYKHLICLKLHRSYQPDILTLVNCKYISM